MQIVQHVTDESLERYAMQMLPDSELSPLEEHLLTCPNCLDRLKAEMEFVAAMRDAAVTIRNTEALIDIVPTK